MLSRFRALLLSLSILASVFSAVAPALAEVQPHSASVGKASVHPGALPATVYGYVFDVASSSDNYQAEIALQLEKNLVGGAWKVRADAHVLCMHNYASNSCMFATNWKVKLYRDGVLVNATVANCGNHPGDWGTPWCPDWGSFNFYTSYMPWSSGTTWQATLTHGDFAKADVRADGGLHTWFCEGEFGNPNSSTAPCLQTPKFLLG